MKKLMVLAMVVMSVYACNSNGDDTKEPSRFNTDPNGERIPTPGGEPATYDPNRGTGKFTHIDLGDKLNAQMAAGGEKIYGVKCAGCHKLTDEKLVGPGWLGVTHNHQPEWIMNFITNTDVMLDKDPKAQTQLAICLVRMPNQSLADNDARNLLEFMRKNDGIK